ncbi:MAG: hypothetical protein H6739_34810 [Alphaproteobacteria bacterium]|nr:hypothetical protein [Alphaproteobacteria bacterium]
MPVPVHVVAGFLGAGKTTLLLDQLARRQDQERCAVIVNDFGEARIDATLLGGTVAVSEIAGGCVCCTAPEALVPSLQAILGELAPDRVFIEATGLARPADILDTLARSPLAAQVTLAPVVVVLDPRRLVGEPPPLLLEQLDAADIAVLNRASLADDATWDAWEEIEATLYPPLIAAPRADMGVVSTELFDLRRDLTRPHDHDHDHASTEGWSAVSRVWPAERVFDHGALTAALEASDAERVKGLFRTDLGWYRFDRASGQVDRVPSGLRSASAVDVIVQGRPTDALGLVERLDAAEWTPPQADAEPVVRLVDPNGSVAPLTRLALAALPDQVEDLSAQVPGRQGRAVPLREVLALMGPASTFVLVAGDGLTTPPAPVAEVGDALLAHSLGDGPFPQKQGGPYRVFVPPGDRRSACVNVKDVVRIVLQG